MVLSGLPAPAVTAIAGAAIGLVAHLGFFIRGEWHVYAPQIFLFHSLLFGSLSAGAWYYHGSELGQLFADFLLGGLCYVVTLLTSILTYRVYFHPLTRAGFKGPWYMRISKLAHVWACRTSLNHLILDEIHKKYGDFARTGPNEITVFHPGVFAAVDGSGTECIKSEWFDLLYPDRALITARVLPVHNARRKDWKLGFSTEALHYHQIKALKHLEMLDKLIEADAKNKRPSQMRDLFYWYGFDFMGDFVFNKPFNMLGSQKWHHMVVRLQRALSLLGPASPAPWLIQLAFRLGPKIMQLRDWDQMANWTRKEVQIRLSEGFEKQPAPDLTHYLLEETNQTGDIESVRWMRGDSLQAIVAGSEPIPVVLLGIFAELAQKPEHIELIYQELQGVDITDAKALSRLPHLNAVISETLRLYPVLLTAGSRKAGKSGVTIGGTYIPPHTTIILPRYTIQRREDCFVKANEFIPERWTTQRELVINSAANNPWGTGHHSCLARLMAMDMMRCVTAKLVSKYRFRLAPGDTGRRVLEDMKDQLAPNPGKLSLCFELR
ncbi:hypothetical protein VTK26DRAFT_6795 [Humicola hyalothermophila]